ncbi:flagellar biosynthetic protein FliR [Jatrophihabitans endophyticus]|uniref:Flagellar biosynthetic protein FliR n=1 Tax=Jatrophihabitans endophyticus TaxID=1206085 RepID=A0A1M5IGV7_9ACTN|nr:flagellar biosynthetic protein FliR [Jatrophihabitans endophyticus]SHG27548.1 flagellar biosynthetic protein FliR [Jatrophihabitans endophyticus]
MRVEVDGSWLLALVLASTRIIAWALVAPPLATGGLPRTVKAMVSVALAVAVLPVVRHHLPAQEAAPIVSALVIQIALGAGLGFLTRLVFTAVEAAGGLLDVFGGFSLSAAYDPLSTTMNSVFGRFYALLCTTLIFATNVHLVIFRGFLQTFTTVPLDSGFSMDEMAKHITGGVTDLFVSALQIAGPLIVVLFIADVALGVLNRIAPQLNAFSMSFPVKIGLTLLLVGLTFTLLPQTVTELATRSTQLVAAVTS